MPWSVSTRPGAIALHPGPLVDPAAAPLDRAGQAADQPGRVHRRAVGGVGAAERRRWRASRARRLAGVEQPYVVLAAPPGRGRARPRRGRGASCGARAGQGDVPPLWARASMPSAAATGEHLVDGGAHRLVLGQRARPGDEPGSAASVSERRGEQRRAPAAVAAGGAEAGGLGLEHRDPQRRVLAQQVVGGPQPGEPGRRRPRRRRRASPGSAGRGVQSSSAVSCHSESRPSAGDRASVLSARPTSRSACAAGGT